MVNSRQADRLGVEAQGSFRRGPGLAQAASVVDLTPLGCRLIDIPHNLSRGEALTLRIGSVGPIPATVRWLKLGREAGLEFDTPLTEVAFNILLGQHRLTPLDPYRAELRALHNDAIAPAEAIDTEKPEPAIEDKVVPIHAHDPEAERRASLRIAANDPAMMLGAGGDPVEVRIADFSNDGMRLGLANANISPGSPVSIVFPDNEIVHGEVRWNNGQGLGIRVLGVGDDLLPAATSPVQAYAPAPAADPDIPGTEDAEKGQEPAADDDVDLPCPVAQAETGSPHDEPSGTNAAAFLTELDCAPEGLAALSDMPTEHLERFAALLEAAKACEFAAISVRVTAAGIEMDLAYRP